MLKTKALDGVTVGEVAEAEEGIEGEHLRRRRILPLRQAAMWKTQRWSSSCSCTSHRVAVFAFPRRSQGCWRSTSRQG